MYVLVTVVVPSGPLDMMTEVLTTVGDERDVDGGVDEVEGGVELEDDELDVVDGTNIEGVEDEEDDDDDDDEDDDCGGGDDGGDDDGGAEKEVEAVEDSALLGAGGGLLLAIGLDDGTEELGGTSGVWGADVEGSSVEDGGDDAAVLVELDMVNCLYTRMPGRL